MQYLALITHMPVPIDAAHHITNTTMHSYDEYNYQLLVAIYFQIHHNSKSHICNLIESTLKVFILRV
jgi:hypothetical protein